MTRPNLPIKVLWSASRRHVAKILGRCASGYGVDLTLDYFLSQLNSQHVEMVPFKTKCSCVQVDQFVLCCSSSLCLLQFDFALWMPNRPPSMLRPPPQVKGSVTEDDIMSFLPDVNSTCRVLTVLALLSQPSVDFVSLHPHHPVCSAGKTNTSFCWKHFYI